MCLNILTQPEMFKGTEAGAILEDFPTVVLAQYHKAGWVFLC